MIGNAEEAQFISDWYRNSKCVCVTGAPEGWKYLGSGSYRTAYLSPSGVVYKVQQDPGCSYQSNRGEWDTYRRLYYTCKMPKHSRLPKMGFFPMGSTVGVIAAEFIPKECTWYRVLKNDKGEEYMFSDVVRAVRDATRIGDLYGENVRLDANNMVVPTDIASDYSDVY